MKFFIFIFKNIYSCFEHKHLTKYVKIENNITNSYLHATIFILFLNFQKIFQKIESRKRDKNITTITEYNQNKPYDGKPSDFHTNK